MKLHPHYQRSLRGYPKLPIILSIFLVTASLHAQTLSIGNLVWDDLNGDGVHDEGEPGIGDVGLNLYIDDGDGVFGWPDESLMGTSTDADGRYEFADLPAGNYFITVEGWNFGSGQALFGKVSSPGHGDANNGVDNDDNGIDQLFPRDNPIATTLITLDHGSGSDLTVDFGFYIPENAPVLSIGDLVWDDLNGNSVQDADEPGIADVTLNLFIDNGDRVFDGNDLYATTAWTASDGRYEFIGLPADNYFIQIDGWEFNSDRPLFGKVSSPGHGLANDGVVNDDNGIDEFFPSIRESRAH